MTSSDNVYFLPKNYKEVINAVNRISKYNFDTIAPIINELNKNKETLNQIVNTYNHLNKPALKAIDNLNYSLKKMNHLTIDEVISQINDNTDNGELEKTNLYTSNIVKPTRQILTQRKFKIKGESKPNKVSDKKFLHILGSKLKDKEFHAEQIITLTIYGVFFNILFQLILNLITQKQFIKMVKGLIEIIVRK